MTTPAGPDVVQATGPFATGIGARGAVRVVHKGQTFAANDPIVLANPTRFGQLRIQASASRAAATRTTAPRRPAVLGKPAPAPDPAPAAPAASEASDATAPVTDGDGSGTSTPEATDAAPQGDVGGDADVEALTRAELNVLATSVGVADADTLPNKAAVIAAIAAAQAAQAAKD